MANYLGAGVIVFLPVIALPIHFHLLGPKQFGLVSFMASMQAVMALLDSGMGQVLVREVAIRLNSGENGKGEAAEIVAVFEWVYLLLAIVGFSASIYFSNFLANHWLRLDKESTHLGMIAVCGAGVLFAIQFPGAVYRSVMLASQSQVLLNGVISSFTLSRYLVGIITLNYWPTILSFIVAHAAISYAETIVRGHLAWKILGDSRARKNTQDGAFRRVWVHVVGMSGAVWIGALSVQIDRVILSALVPIDQFGYYVVASTVALGLLQLVYPLVQAFLPGAICLRQDPLALKAQYVRLFKYILSIVVFCAVAFSLGGEWLLHKWLRDSRVVDAAYPILSILLIGSALNAFYNVGYMNWIVNNRVGRIFLVNFGSLSLSILVIPFLVGIHGPKGAAFGWVSSNLIGFFISLEWISCK